MPRTKKVNTENKQVETQEVKDDKIPVSTLVEEYNNRATESLKADYLKDMLKVKEYVPYALKVDFAKSIALTALYKYVEGKNDKGEPVRVRTNEIEVKSYLSYLLFCRAVVEAYTNIKIENSDFYDQLKVSGILDKLILGDEYTQPLIPAKEISEFRTICDMVQKDALQNAATPDMFATKVIEQIFNRGADFIVKSIDAASKMDPKQISALSDSVNKGFRVVK